MTARLTTAALATAALLTVVGCNGSTPSARPSASSAAGSAATSSAAPSASSSSASATSSAGPTPVLGPVAATAEARRVLTAARQALSQPGAKGVAARKAVWAGEAAVAVEGDVRLKKVRPQAGADNPLLLPAAPTVLAVSQGPARPAFMVVQTVPGNGGNPVLHLLEAAEGAGPYRIVNSATMLPGTRVRPFAPISTGSPVLDTTAELASLAVAPAALLASYARSLRHPAAKVSEPAYGTDAFATSVRKAAAAQASSTKAYAAFTQSHTPVKGSLVAVGQPDGGALVFAALRRTDSFVVKPGQKLVPPKSFTALVPSQSRIDKEASMTSVELLVFAVPAKQGRARLVAASEHLVSARGR